MPPEDFEPLIIKRRLSFGDLLHEALFDNPPLTWWLKRQVRRPWKSPLIWAGLLGIAAVVAMRVIWPGEWQNTTLNFYTRESDFPPDHHLFHVQIALVCVCFAWGWIAIHGWGQTRFLRDLQVVPLERHHIMARLLAELVGPPLLFALTYTLTLWVLVLPESDAFFFTELFWALFARFIPLFGLGCLGVHPVPLWKLSMDQRGTSANWREKLMAFHPTFMALIFLNGALEDAASFGALCIFGYYAFGFLIRVFYRDYKGDHIASYTLPAED